MPDLDITLPAEAASVTRARHLVADQVRGLDADTLADLELIVAELVSNAVRHGQPEIVLTLRREQFAIDIGVLDHGPGLPERKTLTGTEPSGRGLAIIDKLAHTWTCEPLDGAAEKTVWATINHPRQPQA